MRIPSTRLLNFAGFVFCACLMAYALYAEHVLYLDPCPLCVFQRIAVIFAGLFFLLAAAHAPGRAGSRVYGGLVGLSAIGGAGVAAWHIHLQNLPPDQVPSCGPGLGYMMDTLPLSDVLSAVFTGSGECAEVSWRFLGLSMPTWVLIATLFLAAFAFWNNFRRQ